VSRGTVIVFAKVPESGRVKTRLLPAFTAEQATKFYAAMLSDVLEATAAFASELGLSAVAAIHPWELRGRFLRLAPPGLRIVPQRGVNLAARMAWTICEVAAAGARRIVLRGSDSPTLDLTVLRDALAALEVADLVLRPDRDGGYGLVAVRGPIANLFDHPMSTRSVLADTLANAEALGLRSHVLSPSFDIDTVEDLAQLAEARSAGRVGSCRRTLAYLDGNGLWPDVGARR
jgi:rSAM/selenodomain-associated transferase 1